ncbi:MAG: multicopper oxidase domain-containing protein [Putridiphycobacter sp.]
MTKYKLFVLITLSLSKISFSSTIFDTLYINKGVGTIAGLNFQICAFNDSTNFKMENSIIEVPLGDNLQLHVVNNDTLEHTFTIQNIIESNNQISPLGNKDFLLNFSETGPYQFYSEAFHGKALGASSIIMYGYDNYPKYYWNMFEQSDTLSDEIAALQVSTSPFDYQPDIFMINMKVHPDLENDTLAKINHYVGDTIYISVLNSGKMLHTLHFHGYHVEIIKASKNNLYDGWIKDSFGILEDEIVFVRLIPDQPGMFPVHDHNLINVTTNGLYPGGMINVLNIQP